MGDSADADKAPNRNEEATQTLPLRAAYAFGATHGLEREVTKIREIDPIAPA